MSIVFFKRIITATLFFICSTMCAKAQDQSKVYGTWVGDVINEEEVTGKVVVLIQDGSGEGKLQFIISFLDLQGKEQGTPELYKGYYLYYPQEPVFKHKATVDISIVKRSDPNTKVKGKMFFALDETNNTKLFTGSFGSKKDAYASTPVKWMLKSYEDALLQASGVSGASSVLDYGAINDFHDGYAIVRKGERYAVINAKGEEFIPLGKYGFDMGKESYGSLQDRCGFFNGMSVVKDVETEKFGYVDSTGKLVVPCTLREAAAFRSDGFGYAQFTDNEKQLYFSYFFDRKGRRYQVNKNAQLIEKSPFVSVTEPDGKTVSFYRKNGSKAFSTQYRYGNYSEGMFRVTQYGDNNVVKYGFMDTTGKLMIPFKFGGELCDFHEGLALYRPKFQDDYQYSYINKKGEELFFLKKQNGVMQGFDFENGYASLIMETGRNKAIVDKQGNILIYEELFKKANPSVMRDISNVMSSPFHFYYEGRNEYGVLFNIAIDLKPGSETTNLFAGGNTATAGGIGRSNTYYTAKGVGMMDYKGNILILPVFSNIGKFDPVSGLAKATHYNANSKKTTQGFINTNGQFILTLKTALEFFLNNLCSFSFSRE